MFFLCLFTNILEEKNVYRSEKVLFNYLNITLFILYYLFLRINV